jgi:hypothetical protein
LFNPARNLLLVGLLGIGAALTPTGTAFAGTPERDDTDALVHRVFLPPPIHTPVPGNTRPSVPRKAARGLDVSYPQCNGALPPSPTFAIVGVNGGKGYSVNPCLTSELVWAGGAAAELYANTGNPGPALSPFWPSGQTWPRLCDAANPDTAGCAYDYGWNAAQLTFATAQSAYAELELAGSPAATRWWLDVETSNSWRTGAARAFNVAALQGEVDALRGLGVTRLGLYSTRYQWRRITAGSAAFAAYPSWLAGGRTLQGAQRLCTRPAFTGGKTVMAQYFASGFDANLAC